VEPAPLLSQLSTPITLWPSEKLIRLSKPQRKPAEKERLANVEYIAVEATTVSVGEVPGLANRIVTGSLRGETSVTSSDPHEALAANAKFIMIFDPKTGQPLSQEGYVALDTPAKGKMGIFGGYTALYIGTGR
jgi:hypothetical protein